MIEAHIICGKLDCFALLTMTNELTMTYQQTNNYT